MRLAFALLVICLAGLALGLQNGWIRFNHPSRTHYPVQGLDVSHHQGHIDWAHIPSEPWQFVYVKASEGESFTDGRFGENWRGAQGRGLVPGAYHFYSLCKDADVQAGNFLRVLATVSGPSLPPAVDLEFGGNCAAKPSPADLRASLARFLDRVEKASGCRPIIYTTNDFRDAYLGERMPRAGLWLRDVLHLPSHPSWQLWQFANRAHVAGIEGFVDLDVFAGSQAAFQAIRCR